MSQLSSSPGVISSQNTVHIPCKNSKKYNSCPICYPYSYPQILQRMIQSSMVQKKKKIFNGGDIFRDLGRMQ